MSALNDLTLALDAVANAMKDKSVKTDSKKLLQGINNFDRKIEAIKTGLQSIKKDTTQILKNQETLLKISRDKKSEKETKIFGDVGEKKQKIKDGVNTVLMIAGAVLAIGLAFKIIGQVDFLSVIALSVSLPLIAIAFDKIASIKNLNKINKVDLFLTIVTMATSITVASWIMSQIMPISISQGLTAILIAGTFAVISFGIEQIAKGIKKVNAQDLVKMPLVLFSVGLSIALASSVMQFIMPISIKQGLTAILIAGTFALIGMSIEKITKGIKDIKAEDVVEMPFILVTFATAIMASSIIMQAIMPITFRQGLTAIAISVILSIMSLSMPLLAMAVEKVGIKKAALMVVVLPLLATAIMASSYILSATKEVDSGLLFNIVLQSLAVSIMTVTIGGSIAFMNAVGLTPQKVGLGSISIVIIAAAIAAASQILSFGDYTKYPSLQWAIGSSLAILGFGINAMLLGEEIIALGGLTGFLTLGAGLLAVEGIALAIVGAAKIFSIGEYTTYPSFDWALGTSLSILTFGTGMLALGTFVAGTLGGGLLVLALGSKAINQVAQSIVDASIILKNGKYEGGPSKDWAEGVALAIGAFAPVIKVLNTGGILSIFKGGLKLEDLTGEKGVIRGISTAIVEAAKNFNENKVGFAGTYPSKEWAEGVGGAIGAFAPVFELLKSRAPGFFDSGLNISDFTGEDGLIIGIANAIIDAAGAFNKASQGGDIFTGGPTEQWANSISRALTAFQPAWDLLKQSDVNTGTLRRTFEAIADGMVYLANSIQGVNFTGNLPEDFVAKMSSNIKSYIALVDYLNEKDIVSFDIGTIFGITSGISRLANDYDKLAKSVKSLGGALDSLDIDKIDTLNSMTGNVVLMSLMDPEQFEKMMDALESKAGIFVKVADQLQENAERASKNTTYGLGGVGGGKASGASAVETKLDAIVNNTAAISALATNIGSLSLGIKDLNSKFDKFIGTFTKRKTT